jgi:hypothetical protein
MTHVQHKIICKMSSWTKGKNIDIENQTTFLWKFIYFHKHWVTITNTQQKCTLHSHSPTAEILKKTFKNCLNFIFQN